MAVTVDEKLCKGCRLCEHLCPRGVFELSKSVNEKGNSYIVPFHEERCVKCRFCERICPDFALNIE